jgi:hypothetical protein
MKFTIASVFALAATAQAFVPASHFSTTSSTTLFAEVRVDSSELIQKAFAASKKYGPSSVEARLAWEAVEEVDSADSSPATQGTLDEECVMDEAGSAACMEYGQKLEELSQLVGSSAPVLNKMKELTSEIKAVRLAVPKPTVTPPSSELKEAIAKAKEVTAKLGIESDEAKVAWDVVEEISSAGTSGSALGGFITDECLVDAAQDACVAMDELNRFLEEAKKYQQ